MAVLLTRASHLCSALLYLHGAECTQERHPWEHHWTLCMQIRTFYGEWGGMQHSHSVWGMSVRCHGRLKGVSCRSPEGKHQQALFAAGDPMSLVRS